MEKGIECFNCSELFIDGRMTEVKVKNLCKEYCTLYYCDDCFKEMLKLRKERNNE